MESEDQLVQCLSEDKDYWLPPIERNIYVTISSLCSILGITGNTLVIYVIYKKQSLRTVSNFFLCSLAVADLWAGLVPIPIATTVVWFGVYLKCNALTRINDFLFVHRLMVTSLNISAVSMDRLIAVKWPLRYPSIMTVSTTRRALLIIWLTSVVFAIPITCSCTWSILIYWVFISVSTILFSFVIVLYCYGVILKICSAQQQRIIPTINLQPSVNSRNGRHLGFLKNRKAITRFLAVISLLVLAFLPNLICAILSIIPFENCPPAVQALINNWSWCLISLSFTPFVNPCIYALSNKQFRTAFKNMIKGESGSNVLQMVQQPN